MRTILTPSAPAAAPFCRPACERHRLPVCTGEICPHCDSRETRKWGSFSGRRRFRCRSCGRTFSTFTGTPLYYIKRLERWPNFLRAVDDRASVRRAASLLSVHPTTAFRWRHRLLADWRRRDETTVGGRVHLRYAWLAHSEKGTRSIGRPARRRAHAFASWIPDRERVVVALVWERDDATASFVSPAGRPQLHWLRKAVIPRLPNVETILTPLLMMPVGRGLSSDTSRPRLIQESQVPGCAAETRVERDLLAWLRPLRGVATRYLENYLQWFRSDLARGPVTP